MFYKDQELKTNLPKTWSQLAYAGENYTPLSGEDPYAGSWPTFFIKRDKHGRFVDEDQNAIGFNLRVPDMTADFLGKQLDEVKITLNNITEKQIEIAKYWGTGPATKQWTPVIDILIDSYNVTAPRAARILAITQAALNDVFIVAWHFKYLWDVPRPNQLDQRLATVLCTPRHPAYPSGHSTVAGCAEVLLSYFFPPASESLHKLAEECSKSRIYAGVHFPIDTYEGLNLGRQIGEIVVSHIKHQYDLNQARVDSSLTNSTSAKLLPPPYEQALPFKGHLVCSSTLLEIDCDKDKWADEQFDEDAKWEVEEP